jgi:hypothetical protein
MWHSWERRKSTQKIMTGEPERRDFLKDIGEAGKIILKGS